MIKELKARGKYAVCIDDGQQLRIMRYKRNDSAEFRKWNEHGLRP